MIKLILACDLNGVIGNGNSLPWGRSLPYDLNRFRKLTEGHIVVMGRKTFESLGSKPLPNRENVVLTNSSTLPLLRQKSLYFYSDIENLISDYDGFYPNKDLWIIGGMNVYEQFFQYAQEIYITIVHGKFEGDTKLSLDFKHKLFREFKMYDDGVKWDDKDNAYKMSFEKHVRVKGEYN